MTINTSERALKAFLAVGTLPGVADSLAEMGRREETAIALAHEALALMGATFEVQEGGSK